MRYHLAVCLILFCGVNVLAQDAVPAAEAYKAVVKKLEPFIEAQVKDKNLPALSIALIDDQKIVWARGFGFSDPKKKTKATAQTVYRVGSVSKLFTDLAIMRLVEGGKIDLDEPVRKYLRDFKPTNTFSKEITLRHLMSHRSGLLREPPVGNYFDPDGPSIEKTVKSLNQTSLLYEPGKKMQYSNGGIAVVGRVLEVKQEEKFAKFLQRTLLAELGTKRSSFEPILGVSDKVARATMWTYHGREFAAPTFELGESPAGCLYSTVLDLGKFLSMLFAKGKAGKETILDARTLEKMYTPQFVKKGTKQGFGLGFMVSEFQKKRRVGHGGAIYGFATDLSALPDDKLGVVVITSRDCANALTRRIADNALSLMLAVKAKKPLPAIEDTTPLKADEIKALVGRWAGKGGPAFDLFASAGRLFFLSTEGGFRMEVRRLGKELITDDRLGYGMKIQQADKTLKIGKVVYQKQEIKKPADIPAKWRGLIGAYGWDHNELFILEKDGQLHALIEWFFLYPLKDEGKDTFAFPDRGLYPGEKLIFTRDKNGNATQVEAASVIFERRKSGGADGHFRIKPVRSLDEIRKEALKAKPPVERGVLFRKPELVELTKLDSTIKLDVRYAKKNNFLGAPFYKSERAFLQKPAAEALVKIHKKLKTQGYGLLIYDGYRPWSVTKMFWDATPRDLKHFVADPSQGSRHNRGCAVDLGLYDLKTGKPVPMVAGYDEMTDRSYPDFIGGTSLQRYHRDLLRRAMEEGDFTVYEAEWWHFDYKDWQKYPIQNIAFEDIGKK